MDCSSSGQEKHGAHWVSDNDGEQWCLYDLGQKTVLTELNLKLKSGACNPQVDCPRSTWKTKFSKLVLGINN